MHDCDSPERYSDAVRDDGAFAGLRELRQAGKIKEVSLGCNEPEYIMRCIKELPPGTLDSVMVAGTWNLLDQVSHAASCCGPPAGTHSTTHAERLRNIVGVRTEGHTGAHCGHFCERIVGRGRHIQV